MAKRWDRNNQHRFPGREFAVDRGEYVPFLWRCCIPLRSILDTLTHRWRLTDGKTQIIMRPFGLTCLLARSISLSLSPVPYFDAISSFLPRQVDTGWKPSFSAQEANDERRDGHYGVEMWATLPFLLTIGGWRGEPKWREKREREKNHHKLFIYSDRQHDTKCMLISLISFITGVHLRSLVLRPHPRPPLGALGLSYAEHTGSPRFTAQKHTSPEEGSIQRNAGPVAMCWGPLFLCIQQASVPTVWQAGPFIYSDFSASLPYFNESFPLTSGL